jgi:hypothetical protein
MPDLKPGYNLNQRQRTCRRHCEGGSRECAPDDRLRDEALQLSVLPGDGLLRYARNDGGK